MMRSEVAVLILRQANQPKVYFAGFVCGSHTGIMPKVQRSVMKFVYDDTALR